MQPHGHNSIVAHEHATSREFLPRHIDEAFLGIDECRPQYWLAAHVHACATADGVVLLDLRRDRYFGIERAQARVLSTRVADFPLPVSPQQRFGESPSQLRPTLIDSLVRANLLTLHKPQRVVPISSVVTRTKALTSLRVRATVNRSIRVQHVAHFMMACTQAKWSLRTRQIERVVADAVSRKTAAPDPQKGFDFDSAVELVSIFRYLRRYAFTAHGQCLFHSLALMHFLAYYGLFPTWIIGVKTSPWGAHSWVQQDAVVLDSSPEQVSPYIPILTI